MPEPTRVPATVATCRWGAFDASFPPVAAIDPGEVVILECLSGGPEAMPPQEKMMAIPAALREIHAQVPRLGAHIITGPIEVRGAEPGDALRVDIEKIELGADWGFCGFRPLFGTLPEDFPYRHITHIPVDRARSTCRLPFGPSENGLDLPLAPFFGVMGVAPPRDWGMLNTKEPRAIGGNLDNKELTEGSTLYLPVFNEGALFSAGDGHGVQGVGWLGGAKPLQLLAEPPHRCPPRGCSQRFMGGSVCGAGLIVGSGGQFGRSTPQSQAKRSPRPVSRPPRSNRHSQSFPAMQATWPSTAGVQAGGSCAAAGRARTSRQGSRRSIPPAWTGKVAVPLPAPAGAVSPAAPLRADPGAIGLRSERCLFWDRAHHDRMVRVAAFEHHPDPGADRWRRAARGPQRAAWHRPTPGAVARHRRDAHAHAPMRHRVHVVDADAAEDALEPHAVAS